MRIEWHQPGERRFETGVDRGVLYPRGGPGVPWNGLVNIAESPVGGEVEPLYFDGIKFLDFVSSEDFQASLEAFSAPPEFAAAEGIRSIVPGLRVTHQRKQTFGLCYRTLIGNDLEGTDFGYKLHLIYNATASGSGSAASTLSDSAGANTRTWTINAVPPPATLFKPTAHIILDSTEMDRFALEDAESYLYGRPGVAARLPSFEELVDILGNKIEEFITEPI